MNKLFQKPTLLAISLSLLSPSFAQAFKIEWPRNPLPPIHMPPNPLPQIKLPDVKVHEELKKSTDSFVETLGQATQNVSDAIKHNEREFRNVFSGGGVGRDEDNRRINEKEALARKEREKAEEIKRVKSESLTQKIHLLQEVTRDFARLNSDMAQMNTEFKPAVDSALIGFNQRSFIKNSLIPSIRSHWSGEAAYSAKLLTLLEESNRDLEELTLNMTLEKTDVKNASSGETAKSVSRAQSAVSRLRQLSKAHDEELEVMLQRAIQYLDETNSGKLVGLLAENENLLRKVHEFVKARQSYYDDELKSAQAELAKLQ